MTLRVKIYNAINQHKREYGFGSPGGGGGSMPSRGPDEVLTDCIVEIAEQHFVARAGSNETA